MPELVRRLRTNRLKTEREAREALIFAHGMASVLGAKVLVAPGETEDCDFVTKSLVVDMEYFCCVQLKELAPADLNERQTLESLAAGLQKYSKSESVLAVHLNRRTSIPLTDLAAVRAPFSEVWFFWSADPDQESWYLFGGEPGSPVLRPFTYPE